jgi:uncharacterized membrane protein
MAEKKDEKEEAASQASLWWMFVPVFLGAIGGWYAWQKHKEKQKEMARIMLILGLVFTLIIIPFYIWLVMQYF